MDTTLQNCPDFKRGVYKYIRRVQEHVADDEDDAVVMMATVIMKTRQVC